MFGSDYVAGVLARSSFICGRCGHEDAFVVHGELPNDPQRLFQDYDELLRMVGDKTIARRAHLLWNRRKPHPRLLKMLYSLYHCPRCHRLSHRLFFRLGVMELQYEPDYLCPDCRSLLIPCLPDEPHPNDSCSLRLWRCSHCAHLNEKDKVIGADQSYINQKLHQLDGGGDTSI